MREIIKGIVSMALSAIAYPLALYAFFLAAGGWTFVDSKADALSSAFPFAMGMSISITLMYFTITIFAKISPVAMIPCGALLLTSVCATVNWLNPIEYTNRADVIAVLLLAMAISGAIIGACGYAASRIVDHYMPSGE